MHPRVDVLVINWDSLWGQSWIASKSCNFSPFSTISERHTWLLLFIVGSIAGIWGEYDSQKAIICHTWHVVRDGDTGVNVRHSANTSHMFKTEQFVAPVKNSFTWTQPFKAQWLHYTTPTSTLHLIGVVYFCNMIFIIKDHCFSKLC
jgi:hypothetical protein